MHIECVARLIEGFPMGVLDAWEYGLPVITTPVGGIPDIAIDGKNMLLVTPGDIDTLAEQIEKMISNDNLRQSIVVESTLLTHTTFNVKTINQQLGELYEEVMEVKSEHKISRQRVRCCIIYGTRDFWNKGSREDYYGFRDFKNSGSLEFD